jgi:nitronate monooxygenase
MAGGASTPGLVTATGHAGALGFLAAGYKSAAAMRLEIDAVLAGLPVPESAAPAGFGVNVFMPGAPAADQAALAAYLDSLTGDLARLDVTAVRAHWDDDDYPAKTADLVARPVPVVSFTFGSPAADLVAALQRAGSSVWVTVTDAAEAELAAAAGVDCLIAQGAEAGAHRGTFTNAGTGSDLGALALLAAVREVTTLPLVAAGGFMTAEAVAAALSAGAIAVQCGTAFLRCPESGAHPVHKAALADPGFDRTEITRAFSGRPARGLLNQFMAAHRDAPAAYPEINNATRPLRAAAGAASDPHRMSLWAGTGYRQATERPVADVLRSLTP